MQQIKIYCDTKRSGRPHPYQVIATMRKELTYDDMIALLNGANPADHGQWWQKYFQDKPSTRTTIEDGQETGVHGQAYGIGEPRPAEQHATYTFSCSYCHRNAPRRADTLDPILDELTKQGRSKVSLRRLEQFITIYDSIN